MVVLFRCLETLFSASEALGRSTKMLAQDIGSSMHAVGLGAKSGLWVGSNRIAKTGGSVQATEAGVVVQVVQTIVEYQISGSADPYFLSGSGNQNRGRTRRSGHRKSWSARVPYDIKRGGQETLAVLLIRVGVATGRVREKGRDIPVT